MLDGHGVSYRYREYRDEPLSKAELRAVLKKLGLTARDVLRTKDAAKHGVDADASEAALIAAMAEEPTLLQRPILVGPKGAVLGRPVEALVERLSETGAQR
ncbi:MAG: ArsC/Spx/MgsR family protein [Planctomycetota bacterium]